VHLKLFINVPPMGISDTLYGDGFTYDATRPARHCGICGESYQPELARDSQYPIDKGVRLKVDFLLRHWAQEHNKKHSTASQLAFIKSGKLMTPEAALKLIPLGIYPLADLTFDEEVIQAGREAQRAPSDDVPDTQKGVN
jgi:hypothetical protein